MERTKLFFKYVTLVLDFGWNIKSAFYTLQKLNFYNPYSLGTQLKICS